ncbi:hypothetical protein BgAZ_102650 [Babesia gibsoni]|uniref:Uncharacterized protein n=1 Tax=Babesia gibsoni TaxID=33632 RepID=A0AAD8UVI3_BABGI|nr:hypothetical protein BgAZ_102650 [Babesia gibsoni]
MGNKADVEESCSSELLKKRINHLAEAATRLAATLPSVSHALMRQALRLLRHTNYTLPKDRNLYVCFKCGVVRTYCINTKIRCIESNKRQRRKCRRLHMKHKGKEKNKLKNTSIISHQNVMVCIKTLF